MTSMEHYNVVCAIIVNDGKILCMERPFKGSQATAGKWEFPGGKIEPGETAEQALVRELREEMDYQVDILRPLKTIEHRYPDFAITLQGILCHATTRTFNRKEHIDHCWLMPSRLMQLDWAKADELLLLANQHLLLQTNTC